MLLFFVTRLGRGAAGCAYGHLPEQGVGVPPSRGMALVPHYVGSGGGPLLGAFSPSRKPRL
ncbi:hypothetical protein [Micromonospora sp. NPDC002717]|uniref:hypothetical protein n=1 Tax=Micromonospora sp. NPDC002717 TaxID=3154424 RepID=UPI00332C3DD4